MYGMGSYGMGGYGGGMGMMGGYGSSMMGGYGGMSSYGGMGMGSGYGGMGYGSGMAGGSYGNYGSRRGRNGRNNNAFNGLNNVNGIGGDYMNNEQLPGLPPGGSSGTQAGGNGEVQTYGAQGGGALVAPPPPNETPEQKRRRVRRERQLQRRQREAEVEDRRMQRRAFFLSATMELLSNATQIVVHMLRSCYELASILFGTYYSIQAMRSFFASQQQHDAAHMVRDFVGGPRNAIAPANAAAAAAATTTPSVWLSRLRKIGLILGALTLSEMLLRAYRTRQERQRREAAYFRRQFGSSDSFVEDLNDSELEEIYQGYNSEESDNQSSGDDEGATSDNEASTEEEEAAGTVQRKHNRRTRHLSSSAKKGTRRAFTVMHDFTPSADAPTDHLEVKAGDEVVLEGPFSESQWCEAVMTRSDGTQRRGYVPGNYLKLITAPQKF